MEYFVLQNTQQREKNGYYYHILGLQNLQGVGLPQVPPSGASIEVGILEWKIPNNQWNQNHISQHYSASNYKILRAGEELKAVNVTPMSNMPEPLVSNNPLMNATSDPVIVEPVVVKVANIPEIIVTAEPVVRGESPVVVEGPGEIIETPVPKPAKLSPKKAHQLKVDLSKKLTEMGIDFPQNSSLSKLKDLLEDEIAKAD